MLRLEQGLLRPHANLTVKDPGLERPIQQIAPFLLGSTDFICGVCVCVCERERERERERGGDLNASVCLILGVFDVANSKSKFSNK